jgi:hypothetical protein
MPSTCKPDPEKPGEPIIKWFEGFFNAIIAIASLGTSITFTVIVSDIKKTRDQIQQILSD